MSKAIQFSFAWAFVLSPIWNAGASLGIGVGFLLSLIRLIQHRNVNSLLKLWPFLAYFALVVIGLAWSSNMDSGLASVQVQLSFMLMPVLALGAYAEGLTLQKFRRIVEVTLGLSFLLMLIDVFGQLEEMSFLEGITGSQFSLPYMHRAYFMNYIALGVFLWWTDRAKATIWSTLYFALLMVVFWILQGRMNILALTAILPVVLILGLKWKKPRWVYGPLIAGGIMLIGYVTDAIPTRFEEESIQQELEGDETNVPTSNSRTYLWRMGFEVYKKHAFTGTGTGDLHDEMNAQYEEVGYGFALERNYNVHNQILQSLVTFGPIGLLLVIALFLEPLRRAVKARSALLIMWVLYSGAVVLTESYFDRFHGVFLYAAATSFLLLTTKRE